MESVGCTRAMGRGIGQWLNDLQRLDDRARPSVGNDERQRVLVFRTNVDEMNIEAVDAGDELRQGIEPRLDFAPVVFGGPIARERLDRRELYSLGCILNRFSFRPLCRVYASAQFGKFRFGNIHLKRTNLIAGYLSANGLGHGALPTEQFWI